MSKEWLGDSSNRGMYMYHREPRCCPWLLSNIVPGTNDALYQVPYMCSARTKEPIGKSYRYKVLFLFYFLVLLG